MRPRLHLFVCCNRRPDGGRPACGNRGSREVVAALQTAVAARPALWGAIRITETGCLGPCFDGPTIVVYPEGAWYGGVTADEAATLLEHVADGGPDLTDRRLDETDDDAETDAETDDETEIDDETDG